MSNQPPAPHFGPPMPPQRPMHPHFVPVARKTTSAVSWTALGLGALGMLTAIIPGISFLAWVFTLSALVLAIIGLVQKSRARAVAGVSLGLSTVAFITAVIVSVATLASMDSSPRGEVVAEPAASQATAAAPVETAAAAEEDAPQAKPELPAPVGLGQTVTGSYGVTFTVDSVTCGLTTYGDTYFEETPLGEFCEIRFTTLNGNTEPFDFYSDSISATIGDAQYEAETSLSTVGEDLWFSTVNPGLTVSGITVIDIPAGAQIDTISLQTSYFHGNDIVVKLN